MPAIRCSFKHERALRANGCTLIAGIDEVGRGPLAGPVVAAAVILPEKFRHKILDDSKKLSQPVREELYAEFTGDGRIAWAVAIVDHEEIDRINILRATHEAMRRAAAALALQPDHVLIDGKPVHPFPIAQTALIGGDSLSFSIAAASVIAKVTRDRLMVEMDALHPGYERLAVRYLREQNYKVLYRNFRAPKSGGEVDIVCRDKSEDTLVFVEVKTRRSEAFGAPGEAVTRDKQKLIARGALAWLRLLDNPEIPFRFDIVEIIHDGNEPSFNLIKDAFQLPEPYIY
jgi:ribonuclease HII